ncbi:LysR family substrate-binding domain-containing protein [Amycolatopsis mongoliensis]|uniref:LysR family substrate-binding domain-containing protein n=1 Tax=Amycolatopsis mongoliensis TaxID=715475 RepID=A0A9Y2NDL9_9PSEU|nr:LysR family substrate-binding domain-containing protein [Amycolatopsis sp. 4-36]WIY01861.1 LysR family substrate-binding domain-containing protein [Amycolatopsis sp. 4-36]
MTSFRLAYVPGATPAKWVRTWGERQPEVPLELVPVAAADATGLIRSRGADAALLRSPVDRDGLHAIPLYTETTVVVIAKDHLIAAADEVSTADLADEVVLSPLDDTIEWPALPGRAAVARPETTADAIELVAAGMGVLVVPQSLARLHHRRDLTYRTVTDAPQSSVALSWLEDETTDLMETFIGIVRGRTVNSTRGRQPAPAEKKRAERKPAAAKSAGKPAARRGGGAPKRGKPRRKS